MQAYTFSHIFTEVKKYKKELFFANIIALLAVLAHAPTPLLLPLLVDEILLHKPGSLLSSIDQLFGSNHEAYFYVFIVLAVTIFLRALYFALSIWQTWFFTKISKNVTYKIRQDLLSHIQKVSLKEYENFGSGKITSLAIVDVNTIDTFLSSSISKLVISIFMVLAVTIVLLWINWELAIFILLFNPFIIFFASKMGRKVSKLKKKENAIIASFQESLGETLELFWQVRASNRENHFFAKLIDMTKEIRDRGIAFAFKSDASNKISNMIFLMGFETFRVAGILMVAYSDLTIGLMLAIFGYLWVIVNPFYEIINIQYDYHNAKAALERINAIFALEVEPKYSHHYNPFLGKKSNEVILQNVSFSYNNDLQVINDVSMQFSAKRKTAIVGGSGNGKTTLAQLIVGFYQPQKGDILYDGVSYKDIGLDVVRDNVFIVLQNPLLFNDTILFNLTFGKDVLNSKIKEALSISQLEEFISGLDDGLETLVGKNGIKLSGGQRQRISIARMLIADPNIIILDESTSSLDVITEKILFEDIASFLNERTTIIIAHRLSTIKMADYIYVLHEGKITEEGSLEDLMAVEGTFATTFKKREY